MSSKFIKEPLSVRLQKTKEYMENSGQINFHNVAINEVKSRLGKNCTYLSHLDTKGTIWFLAHLIIKGEKRIIRVNTGKSQASELVAENYKALKNQLEDYVTGKKDI